VATAPDDVEAVLDSVAGLRTLSAQVGGDKVVLVAAEGDPRAADVFGAALAATRLRAPSAVGISAVCAGTQGCRVAIAAARTAAHRARRLAAGTGVVTESDLGVVQRLLSAPDHACARLFAQDLLGNVFTGDASAPGRLLETLTVFFECDRSVRRSAQWLGVHENTVRKRLEAVHRLTGLSVLKSASDQLKAQIALAIVASEPT
jgi:sugar diacid utilization regulator